MHLIARLICILMQAQSLLYVPSSVTGENRLFVAIASNAVRVNAAISLVPNTGC